MQMAVYEMLEETGALLEGHFLLSSGRHSKKYVQCAKLLRYPDAAQCVLEDLAKQISVLDPDVLVGPAMGGIIVAYELARQLGVEAIFTERKDGEMCLRRGFEIENGARVIICEDVVTTAKSSMETKKVIEDLGGEVIAIASIIDRTSSEIDLPLYSAIKLEIQTFSSEECPLCKQGVELVKPGSRT